jgi:hypothetical protein|tara:strand:+ start:428 stop:685 length:258 start_codon:yes stop_codon:yes gene_type:complete
MNKDTSRGKQFKSSKKKEKAKYLSYKIEHLHKQGAREKSIADDYARSTVFSKEERKLLESASRKKVKEIEDRTQKALQQYRRLLD